MNPNKPNRKEMILDLLHSYKKELDSLNDLELISHWDAQKQMAEMKYEDWQDLWNHEEQ